LGFRRNAAMILAHLIDYVTKEEWIEVCWFLVAG
jgi:hypothetical protein